MTRTDVWLWWSSGKDSAWSLHELRRSRSVRVTGLVTSVTATFDRVSIHGVRREVLRRQASNADLPLHEVELPFPCSNEQYEGAVRPVLEAARAEGVGGMAFGDLFLEDVRAYRIRLLEGSGLDPLFPLWGRDTRLLAEEMIRAGVEAYITCLDPRFLPEDHAGRRFDARLLEDLPEGVDPCGENGEFHTCVAAGPMLSGPIEVEVGEIVKREGFVYADLVPATAG